MLILFIALVSYYLLIELIENHNIHSIKLFLLDYFSIQSVNNPPFDQLYLVILSQLFSPR